MGYLIIKNSTIPNANEGAFAKRFIPMGQKICMYSGKYVASKNYVDLNSKEKDRCYFINGGYLVGKNIGSKINDTVIFQKYKKEDLKGFRKLKQVPHYKFLHYNCYIQQDGTHLIIYALRDIEKGDELFIDYGFYYWYHRLNELAD